MKNIIYILLICCYSNIHAQQEETTVLPLDKTLLIISNSLTQANLELNSKLPTIKSAEISLSTVYDKSGGGGFKFFVKASRKWELEKASTFTFTYEKPDNNQKKFLEMNEKFETNLKNAIVDAARQWTKSKGIIPSLSKKEFSVEISFTVKNITEAGIEFEVWGIGADIGGDYETSAIHKVTLTFE